MTCEVTKRFIGDGIQRQPGDVVDSSGWPHEAKLIAQRYLRPISAPMPSPPNSQLIGDAPIKRRRGRPPKVKAADSAAQQ